MCFLFGLDKFLQVNVKIRYKLSCVKLSSDKSNVQFYRYI